MCVRLSEAYVDKRLAHIILP